MAQYKVNCDVTNGSSSVTVPGVDATSEISAADDFYVEGNTGRYEVASVSFSSPDTTVTLTTNYGGSTDSGVTGVFHRDFSGNRSYPLLYAGDIETHQVVRRLANLLDADIQELRDIHGI